MKGKCKYSLRVIKFCLFFPYLIFLTHKKTRSKSKFAVNDKLNLFINNYRMHCLSQYFENKLKVL